MSPPEIAATLVVAKAAVFTTSLPNPGDPDIVPMVGLLGGFLGALSARYQRLGRTVMRVYVEDGAFHGVAAGFGFYFGALLMSAVLAI